MYFSYHQDRYTDILEYIRVECNLPTSQEVVQVYNYYADNDYYVVTLKDSKYGIHNTKVDKHHIDNYISSKLQERK